jgi:hypothetical protein
MALYDQEQWDPRGRPQLQDTTRVRASRAALYQNKIQRRRRALSRAPAHTFITRMLHGQIVLGATAGRPVPWCMQETKKYARDAASAHLLESCLSALRRG